MTVRELIEQTLSNYGMEADEQTVQEYRPAILRALNEAYSAALQRTLPQKTVACAVQGESFIPFSALPDDASRVLAVHTQEGIPVRFVPAGEGIRIACGEETVVLTVRLTPPALATDADTPRLPEGAQPLLADFAAWRLMAAGGRQRQSRGEVYLNQYMTALAHLTPEGGQADCIRGKYEGGGFTWPTNVS